MSSSISMVISRRREHLPRYDRVMWPWSLPSFQFTPKRHSHGWLGPWSGHLPFACDLVAAVRPTSIVELGTYYGESYFGFCQAVEEQSLRCDCSCVDTWRGDNQGGYYDEEVYLDVDAYNRHHYASFSKLYRMTFDEARGSFAEESIDILHIDGHHSYDSVAHDFENWFSAVRPGGIVLFHDVSVRLPEFGVWRFWEELSSKYQTLTFPNSCGLGVLQKPGGGHPAEFLASLFEGDHQRDLERYYAVCSERVRLAFNAAESSKAPAGSDACAVQVFYTLTEQGYREEDSAIQVIRTGEWQRLTFAIPYGLRTKPLRLDPADRPSVIEIRDICVKPDGGAVPLWQWDPERSSATIALAGTATFLAGDASQMTVLSTGFDPQLLLLELATPAYEQPLRLELQMKVTPPASWIENISKQLDLTLEARELRSIGKAAQNAVNALRAEIASLGADHDSNLNGRKDISQAVRSEIGEIRGVLDRIDEHRLQLSKILDRFSKPKKTTLLDWFRPKHP
jgi:hypothetical protein